MFKEAHMQKVITLLCIAAIVALLTYSYTSLSETKYMFFGPITISVEGVGEVFATPDVATFTFLVEAKEDDAVSAQNKVSEIMDNIRAYLNEVSVEEKDIKTKYFNLSPRYEYPDFSCNGFGYCPPSRNEPTIVGYQVSQSVSVKVRDTEKAGEILSIIGEKGAMNVSGLSFTIDDEDALMAEAREKAINDAREKAEVLAKNLDARIVRISGFWEGGNAYQIYSTANDGRFLLDTTESFAPKDASLPIGENTIIVKVNISYEIR